jgi:ribosomal-protein-alanine N-acetyltransferase
VEKPLTVRPLAPADLDAVLSIQSSSPGAAAWLRADYEQVFAGDFSGWVAEAEDGIAGFLIARRMADEVEILNAAVSRESRRRGIGTLLLREGLAWGEAAGARRAFLEVRETNFAAILFYERNGFSGVSHRPHYYSDPTESALLLACAIVHSHAAAGS